MPQPAGVDKENTLRAAGFNDGEIEQWRSQTASDLGNAGFSTKEVDDYFGYTNPDMKPFKQAIENNMAQAKPQGTPSPSPQGDGKEVVAPVNTPQGETPREAHSFHDAIEAGFQMSVSGLIKRGAKPDVVLPEDAPMFYRIASQVSGLAGDIPAMIAGGAAAGAAAAPAAAAAGAATGGVGAPIVEGAAVGYGSFALPSAIRKVLMDHYEKGDVKNFNEFWERAAATFIEANKQGLVGAATGGVGKAVGIGAKAVGFGAATKTTAQLTSEVATMTTLGKAIEGETPQPQDFIDAAILVGGMHGAGVVSSKLRGIYAKTGVKPSEIAQRAQEDPLIKQDLLTAEPTLPDRVASENGVSINPNLEQTGSTGKVPSSKEGAKAPVEIPRSDAETKILSQVGEAKDAPKEPYTARTFYKDFVDKFDPIHEAVKVLEENPEKLKPDENPYQLARMANDYKSKVKFVMERGGLDYNTLATEGKSLTDIVAPFKEDMKGFEAYLISKRAIEVEGKDLKSGFDLDSAKQVVKEGGKKYEAAAQEFYQFENQNLKYLKDSGVISSQEFKNMTELNKSHVSFSRILEDEKGGSSAGGQTAKGPNSLKEFKGSDKKIQSPLLSTLENTESIFKVAEKNRAVQSLIELAEKDPEQELLVKSERKGGNLKDNQFEVFRNGEREVWETPDKNLAGAIKALDGDKPATNIFMKIAKTITGIKRLSISMTPDFIVKNFFRDQLTAGAFSKGGSYPFFDAVVAMKDIVGKSDHYYNWLKSGGAGGSFLELNQHYLEDNVFQLNRETGLIDKTWNVCKKATHFLEATSSLAEQATRLAEFKRVSKGEASGANIFAGGFAAREVTVDFSRIGAKMSALNSITAFQNVSIQGLDRTLRAIKEDPLGVTTKAAASITVPSILLWWANKDDERYKQAPRWMKDTFWIIPTDKWEKANEGEADSLPEYLVRQKNGYTEINKGTTYRIPKPQELGILFGSLPERVLEKYFTDNPNATKDFDKTMMSLVTPSIVPDAISPLAEQKFNKSIFTDNKIVPDYLTSVAPEYQYTEYTSASARELAKMIKFIPGVGSDKPGDLSISSPMVIDNYARAWAGNIGGYVLRVADQALYKAGVVPEPVRPASTLADIPVVKAFVVRYPSANAQSIQDFYDNYDKEKQYFDTVKHLAKSQEFDAMEKELERVGGGDEVFLKLDGMKQALTTQSQVIRIINKNPDYTPDEKRQLIDGVYYGMIEITKAGNELLYELKRVNKELKKQKQDE